MIMKLGEVYKVFNYKKKSNFVTTLEIIGSWTVRHSWTMRRGGGKLTNVSLLMWFL